MDGDLDRPSAPPPFSGPAPAGPAPPVPSPPLPDSRPEVAPPLVRRVVALVLLGSGAALILSALATMATVDGGDFPFIADFGVAHRLQAATSRLDLPAALLLPLALLVLRPPGARTVVADRLERVALVAAGALAAVLAVLVLLGLVANLAGHDFFHGSASRAGAAIADAAVLAVTLVGGWWAWRELPRAEPVVPHGAPSGRATASAPAPPLDLPDGGEWPRRPPSWPTPPPPS